MDDEMTPAQAELGAHLCARFAAFSELPALWLGGQEISYGQLFADASHLADIIVQSTSPGDRLGLLAQRSYAAYAGILASILSSRPYVPLNMKFPLERQLSIARIAHCKLFISDSASKRRAAELIGTLGPDARELSVIPMQAASSQNADSGRFLGRGSDVAYVMFTSGTTGVPKGVAVRRENLSAYLRAIARISPITPTTRCTQNFDLSFDLSVHDVFQTWASGGCLYVMDNEDTLDPVGFAKRHALQAWFSVPSVAAMARRLDLLKPDMLPDLKLSLFCGEPLPVSVAEDWAKAAPNSRIFNLYGPTEATIAITAEEYIPASPNNAQLAVVPLGTAFENSAAVVVKDGAPSNEGELWLGGAQISNGYINNEAENQAKFVKHRLPGHPYERWYRTGDLVRLDAQRLLFQGRLDEQVKVQGYRVELLEIEGALRRAAETSEVAAAPWPLTEAGAAEGIVAFVCSSPKSEREIIARCRTQLAAYAVPRKVLFVDALPLNANGKVDRKALRTRLQNS